MAALEFDIMLYNGTAATNNMFLTTKIPQMSNPTSIMLNILTTSQSAAKCPTCQVICSQSVGKMDAHGCQICGRCSDLYPHSMKNMNTALLLLAVLIGFLILFCTVRRYVNTLLLLPVHVGKTLPRVLLLTHFLTKNLNYPWWYQKVKNKGYP